MNDAVEHAELRAELGRAHAELAAMRRTLSWRVTAPLRALRGSTPTLARRRRPRGRSQVAPVPELRDGHDDDDAAALVADVTGTRPATEPDQHGRWEEALAAHGADGVAWLVLFAHDRRGPTDGDVAALARRIRMFGPSVLDATLSRRRWDGPGGPRSIEIVRDSTIVDVTHTAGTDLRTGVQRVVHDAISRWAQIDPAPIIAAFDPEWGALRRISVTDVVDGASRTRDDAVLLPWRCRLVLPEIAGERHRCDAHRAALRAGAFRTLDLIAYDLVPIVAPETTSDEMAVYFANYLSLLKHARNIVAISETTADAFRALGEMGRAEGRAPAAVRVVTPPVEMVDPDPAAVDRLRTEFGRDGRALIVVVGSHEPRKNHAVILEAAEALWAANHRFELLFLGGNAWASSEFDGLVAELRDRGRPVHVRRAVSDQELRAAYALARFTVYPSTIEGYGLPIAESLAAGTPVITSAYGSMAEVAGAGGCLTIDPRDPSELAAAMRSLLADDAALDALRRSIPAVAARPAGFAAATWAALEAPSADREQP